MILRSIRFCLQLIRDFDGVLSYISTLPFPNRYKVRGACLKRGVCCQNVAIQLSETAWNSPRLKSLILRWYSFVYNFTIKGENADEKVLIFTCNYLKNSQCSIYWRRPYICRNYPRQGYFAKPALLPGCGYSIE